MLDFSTDLGKRIGKQLESEHTIWLTTVGSDNTPQPRPVWFVWDGETLLVYSEPNTHKLRHIERSPRVAVTSTPTSEASTSQSSRDTPGSTQTLRRRTRTRTTSPSTPAA